MRTNNMCKTDNRNQCNHTPTTALGNALHKQAGLLVSAQVGAGCHALRGGRLDCTQAGVVLESIHRASFPRLLLQSGARGLRLSWESGWDGWQLVVKGDAHSGTEVSRACGKRRRRRVFNNPSEQAQAVRVVGGHQGSLDIWHRQGGCSVGCHARPQIKVPATHWPPLHR